MGTSCAAANVNLYLGRWERYITSDDRYTESLEHVLLWYRNIIDLLIVWIGTKDGLLDFFQSLNDKSFNVKFKFGFDSGQIPFLDLSIAKQPDGTLDTDLYCKPTSCNTLRHTFIAHPGPT